jgi:PAS domain S-box-containing protein
VGGERDRTDPIPDALDGDDGRLAVETASGVRDGLGRLAEGEIDCVVSDAELPDGDGIEFLEDVRERGGTVPFVLVAAEGSERLASEAISAGVTDYVPTTDGTEWTDALADSVHEYATAYRTERPGPSGQRTGALESDLLRSVSDAVVERCPGTGEVRQADGIEGVTGDSPEVAELSSGWWCERVHPEDRARVRDGIDERLAAGRAAYAAEYRFRHADGSYRVLEERGRVRYDDEGAPRRLVGALRDVTGGGERSRGCRSRSQRLDQYETILKTLPVGVAVLDEMACVEWVNEAFWTAVDKDEEEVGGMQFIDLIEEGVIEHEIADKYLDGVRRLLSSENDDDRVMVEFELEPPHEDEPREYEGYIALQPLDDGEYNGTVNVFLDVTERKRRERELEQYRAAMETVPDGVLLLDEEGTMTRVNEAWAEIVGYDQTDLNGRSFPELVDDGVMDMEVIESYIEVVSRLLSSKPETERGKFTTRVSPPDKRTEHVYEVHIGLLPYEEEFQGTAGVVRDISGKVERQQQLERENERLEEFASIVSHDLRNPLTVAKGFTERAQETGEVDPLDRAMTALDRMESIIGDVLELARQGETITDTHPVHLPTLFETCWGTVETRDARPVVDGADDDELVADPDRLKQLLENLVRNAVEHGGDDVTVRVGTTPSGFYVEDDGPGIPDAERDRVFDSGYSTSTDGTGFGLNIVEQIATAHGWTVAATTGEDGGARFEVTGVEFTD